MQTRKTSFILITLFLLAFLSPSLAQALGDFTNLGIYGGHVSDIAIDPLNPDKMFAASYEGDGLFVTIDGGNNWQAVDAGGLEENGGEDAFRNHSVEVVKIAPGNSQVIWVAHNMWTETSMDGGASWTHILNSAMQRDCQNCGGETDDFRFALSLAIDPEDAQIVYVGAAGPGSTYGSGAIYKTLDGGTSWQKMNQGNDLDFAVVDIVIDPQNRNTLWAVTSSFGFGGWGGSLYRSGDGGNTWAKIFSLTPPDSPFFFASGFITVAVKPGDSNTVFTGSGFGLIKHSFDGSVWNFTFPVIPGSRLAQDITFDPQNPDIVYTTWLAPPSFGGDGIGKVARSTDGGNTWPEIFPHDFSFKSLTVHPTNSEILFAGEFNEGTFKSTDHGQTWLAINKGINAAIVYDVAVNPIDNTHILAATFAGLYEKKGENPWTFLVGKDTSIRSVRFHSTDPQTYFAGLESRLAKTIDGGQSWTFSNAIGPNGLNPVQDIAIDPTNPDTIYLALGGFTPYGEISKSTDGGVTFSKVLDGINLAGEKYDFNSVVIDPSDSQHLFAGGGSYFAPQILGDLWESLDGGTTWERTSLQNVIINALLISPEDSAILYAGAGDSGGTEVPLYKSTDGGLTWLPSFEGIPGSDIAAWNAVTDLEFHKQNKNIVYASTTRQGVYISPNRGANWLNLGTPKYDVFAIAVGSLYAATQGGLQQLTGTGLIYGKIWDAPDLTMVDHATVQTDLGVETRSLQGEYMLISPAGIFDVSSIAEGYLDHTVGDFVLNGGDATQVNFAMQRKPASPSPSISNPVVPGNGSAGAEALPEVSAVNDSLEPSSDSSKKCFIATAAYGSPLSKQVKVLRKFRDVYLLTNAVGRKLVAFYYDKGRSPADFIERHDWLKPPIRFLLYPLVWLAWLMLSTSALMAFGIVLAVSLLCYAVFKKDQFASRPPGTA